jgi:tRNA dimethylallyltransferase
MERDVLYDRINRRVDEMVKHGLADEARSLLPYRHLNALNTVGYTELFDYFDGKTDLETAIALIKQNTRRFAKRQMTWFKKDKDIHWIDVNKPGLADNIIAIADTLV